MTTTLTCPKCASDMRSYERNRVLVDQCTGCGGLFLDRGELEKLVAAENEWHGAPAAAVAAPPPQDRSYAGPQDRGYQQGYDQHSDHRYDNRNDNRYDNRYDQRGDQQPPYAKKRTSFLSELFDD